MAAGAVVTVGVLTTGTSAAQKGERYGQEKEEDHSWRIHRDGHGRRGDGQHADGQRADGRFRLTGKLISGGHQRHYRGRRLALTTAHTDWSWTQRWGWGLFFVRMWHGPVSWCRRPS